MSFVSYIESSLGVPTEGTAQHQSKVENRWIRHRTWVQIGNEHPRPSVLVNQFALAEYELSEEQAASLYHSWLWDEMQNEFGVVWRELSQLASAQERGEEVGVWVMQGAQHGELIARAVTWMIDNTREVPLPKRVGLDESSIDSNWDMGDHWDIPDEEEQPPSHRLVWITGNTQSRLGCVVGFDKAMLPDYGEVRMSKFHQVRWIDREAAIPLQSMIQVRLDRIPVSEVDFPNDIEPSLSKHDRFDADRRLELDDDTQAYDLQQGVLDTSSLALAHELRHELDNAEAIEAVVQVANLPESVNIQIRSCIMSS